MIVNYNTDDVAEKLPGQGSSVSRIHEATANTDENEAIERPIVLDSMRKGQSADEHGPNRQHGIVIA